MFKSLRVNVTHVVLLARPTMISRSLVALLQNSKVGHFVWQEANPNDVLLPTQSLNQSYTATMEHGQMFTLSRT